MKRVSVIGTVHKDSGLANASELLVILECIQPEVIFLEVPAAGFDDSGSGTLGTLESTAVSRYRRVQQAALVAVDLPTPQGEFFWNSEDLHKTIERRRSEYCRLVDWHSQYVRAYGFAYLNSDHCSKLFSELHEAMLSAIRELADNRLAERYQLWRSTNELRDLEMMKNIEEYCQNNASDNGVLLVGAAHRQSIRDKSREGSAARSSVLHWEFPGFGLSVVNALPN